MARSYALDVRPKAQDFGENFWYRIHLW